MINVVFLLLIFFLLTAQIAPSTPFPLAPPDSGQSDIPAEARDVLFISATGELAWNEARDDAVWSAIAAAAPDRPVEIRADSATPAASLAAHLKRLREITDHGAQLVVSGG
ncbi:MAG: biopolymer transporter ExbD [Pararhodobacter sp.]